MNHSLKKKRLIEIQALGFDPQQIENVPFFFVLVQGDFLNNEQTWFQLVTSV